VDGVLLWAWLLIAVVVYLVPLLLCFGPGVRCLFELDVFGRPLCLGGVHVESQNSFL